MASLESSIDALTAAVTENSALLKQALSGKAVVAGKVEEKTETKTTRTRASSKDKAPTQADVKKAAEAFLDKAGNDEENYNERRAHIKKIIAKFDAPKLTEVAEEDRAAALAMLAEFDKEDDQSSNNRDDNDI